MHPAAGRELPLPCLPIGLSVEPAENAPTCFGARACPRRLGDWQPMGLARLCSPALPGIVGPLIVAEPKPVEERRRGPGL